MKEHPILFSTPMVRAILSGAKTQTRRVCKRQPPGAFDLCRYGEAGDLLWVRETWAEDEQEIAFKADEWYADECPFGKWRPSIFMPRAICRINLKITDVRAERLQDISLDDVHSEGITTVFARNEECGDFVALWDSINAKRGFGWNANPWVWVIEFKRIETSGGHHATACQPALKYAQRSA